MECLNTVTLMGNLVSDAADREIRSDLTVQDFRIAVNNNNETLYIDVSTFNKSKIAQYLTKGRGIIVHGRLKMESWEKDGRQYNKISVVGEKIVFLPGTKTEEKENFDAGHHE
jgi:single-strand DNA-binding protein